MVNCRRTSIAFLFIVVLSSMLGQAAAAVTLPHGSRVLVLQERDYFGNSRVIEGTGNALMRSTYNALSERGASPLPGSHVAVINGRKECESLQCDYIVKPRLERYNARSAVRAKVRVTLELIDPGSGEALAGCDATETGWIGQGREVQELMRPAVDACLDELVKVEGGAGASATAETDEFLVVPSRELWVLKGERHEVPDDYLTDHLLELLRQNKLTAKRGPTGVDTRELFMHAREVDCNRIFSVKAGLVWTSLGQPVTPRLQLILSLVDVASKNVLQTVLAESDRIWWTEETTDHLTELMQAGVDKLLGHTTPPLAPDVTLSLIEPATVISEDPPRMPKALRKKKPRGTVKMEIVVDETGKVVEAKIIESVPELDEYALRLMKKRRYLPARCDGEPCPMHLVAKFKIAREW